MEQAHPTHRNGDIIFVGNQDASFEAKKSLPVLQTKSSIREEEKVETGKPASSSPVKPAPE